MAWLSSLRAQRAVAALAGGQPEAASEAVATLRSLGTAAVPALLEGLDGLVTGAVETFLADLVEKETLPVVVDGLRHRNPKIVEAVVRVLGRAKKLDPNDLLELFHDPEVPKASLLHVLLERRKELKPPLVLRLLDDVDAVSRASVLRLVQEVATESQVPQLIKRLTTEDVSVRLLVIRTLARFASEETRATLLQVLLSDPNKQVRIAALEGLEALPIPPPIAPMVQLLRDPDLVVQSRAMETLVRLRRPETVQHLISLLQDEAERVRRAAVEVLNEIGDPAAIRALVEALRDKDWWVSDRAADALASIGGARVVEGVLPLVIDGEEFVRQTAIAILKRIKNETTFDYLVERLNVEPSEVRDAAVTALGALGDRRAVPFLIPLLEHDPERSRPAIAALGLLGDPAAVLPLLARLEAGSVAVQRETLHALERLTDEQSAPVVLEALRKLREGTGSGELRDLTLMTVTRIGERFSGAQLRPATPPPPAARPSPSPAVAVPAIDPLRLAPGDLVNDRYEVLRQIGRGGFGVVTLVRDRMVNEEIVLKIPGPNVASDASTIERFKDELRTARKISHENVVRTHDLIVIGSTFAIAMEYFPSRSLAAALSPHSSIGHRRGLLILAQACRGLSAAHAVGVVHRDLKPANVLVGDGDQVKLADFGLAAAASDRSQRLTRSGLVMGTPAYMAPEQVLGKAVDPRTDIYCLGVVMYEVFAGRLPYERANSMAIMFQHLEGKPRRPSEINPAVTPELEALILKAMAVDPAARYPSADALYLDLLGLSVGD